MNAAFLRKKYPRFVYKGYSFVMRRRDAHLSFEFEVAPDIRFHPKVVIKNVPKDSFISRNLVFHVGLMEIPSYWKATCSPEIVVEAGFLSKEQIAWWKDLILKGMGEFFYKNKIDFTQQNFLTFKVQTKPGLVKPGLISTKLSERTIIPIGGGKDGVVTLELLKKMPHRAFLLNPKREQRAILETAGEKKPIVVERAIDPKLLELNRKGYLNGHTPFSAYLAFLTTLCAALFNYKYIALSNERSSNEGNVRYLKRVINHQYSKSYEFEKKFREYSKKYLAKDIEYFSFLRPLYELQIAKIFATYPKYFPVFLSCNEAQKTASGAKKPTGKWCGKCAKCLFVWLVLYPFVPEKQLAALFKKNLFQDKTLTSLLEELTGKRRFKPFECVGTTKESEAALSLCRQKQKGELQTYPRILQAWSQKHFLPSKLARLLENKVKLNRA